MTSTTDIVRRFRHLRALVIGDAILDTYLEGTAVRLCTEGPVPVVSQTAEHRLPGGAANTASNLRALGASVTFLGIVGDDAAGETLRRLLRERHVDDRCLLTQRTAATIHKLRILADGHYVVRFDQGTAHHGDADLTRQLLAALDAALPACDVVVVSDYCYGVLSDAVIERLRTLRARWPRPLIVDSKQLQRFKHAGATVVTPNALEARLLVGWNGDNGDKAESEPATAPGRDTLAQQGEVARRVLAALDAEHVALTLANDGILLTGRAGQTWHIPAYPVAQVYDVGAGDSFASALALALAAGADPQTAAHIGCEAAGIAVSKRFTALVEHRELLQRISVREHADHTTLPWRSGRASPRKMLAQVQAWLTLERTAGRTIVFTNGIFDILHAAHIEFLRQAKALGDVLVVGINSDTSVRRLNGTNGTRGLINNERDRLALVAALEPVDVALLFDEDTPAALIRALEPHIHVKGGDYADEDLPEAAAVREAGGRVVIIPLADGLGAGETETAVPAQHHAARAAGRKDEKGARANGA